MTFYNKVKWVLGILMIFVLIITTNLIDRNNFITVRDSVQTIYEDRLVVKELIFEISNSIKEKELALAKSDSVFFIERNSQINGDIESAILQYEETKLTVEEKKVFDEFKNNFESLKRFENAFISSGFETSTPVSVQITGINKNLSDLSKIQMNEGRRQMAISKKAIDTVELFTQMEIYLLIFLAIVIQIIVIYNPKEKSK